MSTQKRINIKNLIKTQPHNTVLTSGEMLRRGVSRELQRSAVRSGWLTRLGTGAYTVLDEPVGLEGAIYTLQTSLGLSVHQGAYTALNEKHGKTHNLSISRKPQLFSYRGEKIPAWFRSNYGSSYDLFVTSFLPSDLGFTDYDAANFKVKIPVVERAILEMLYLTPSVHTLQETYQVMELLGTAKPAVMQNLLEACSSIKVKRLFLYMAERAGLAWFKRRDLSKIDLGRGDREITKGGLYDKKYRIVIGNVEAI
jgi:hypothetical protein